jgi:hypothetical protein
MRGEGGREKERPPPLRSALIGGGISSAADASEPQKECSSMVGIRRTLDCAVDHAAWEAEFVGKRLFGVMPTGRV